MGFTDLERELYSIEYNRWKNSPWGYIQRSRIKIPAIPPEMRYARAIAIAEGKDPNTVYKVPSLEPDYEQLFLNETSKRKAATKQ